MDWKLLDSVEECVKDEVITFANKISVRMDWFTSELRKAWGIVNVLRSDIKQKSALIKTQEQQIKTQAEEITRLAKSIENLAPKSEFLN